MSMREYECELLCIARITPANGAVVRPGPGSPAVAEPPVPFVGSVYINMLVISQDEGLPMTLVVVFLDIRSIFHYHFLHNRDQEMIRLDLCFLD